MTTRTEFQDLVANAYQYLYDFVRLRNHPLTDMVITDTKINPKEKGWQLHHMLLGMVDELYPGPAAPPYSREWRRHRLMVLRYVEAMEPQAVADQLAISRRQYYREHTAAIEAIADILWERSDHSASHQTDVMQRELARINQNDVTADLTEVIEGVLAVLEKVLNQNRIDIQIDWPGDTPVPSIGHNLLRQVMLGVLGYLAENSQQATLCITGYNDRDNSTMHLEIVTDPPQQFNLTETQARQETFQEMVQLGHADITLIADEENGSPVGFDLELPVTYECTILAVDDNEDTLALYKRFLTPNHYHVITTKAAQSVLDLTRSIRPDIIILDLMMPDQDGWDLLQLLANQPDTAHIPIMICSVLKQKHLALSLGAAEFLEKPFTEQSLLTVLDTLRKEN